MTRLALHLGLNSVDPDHYSGWSGPLAGCENDARAMAALTRAAGFNADVVLTRDAKAERVLDFLDRAATVLHAGDRLVLTFAGHGSQVPAAGDGGEEDGYDETWALYDRMLLDGEVNAGLARLRAGVRALVVLDCCHSGTAIRMRDAIMLAAPSRDVSRPAARGLPLDVALATWTSHWSTYRRVRRSGDRSAALAPDAILLAACQDHQVAADGDGNGAFTAALLKVWDGGRFAGDHDAFVKHIARELPLTQIPNLDAFGPTIQSFVAERPFSPGASGPSPQETTMTTTSTFDGNWREVSAELERRLGGQRGERTALGRTITANAQAALLAFFGPGAVVPVPVSARRDGAAARGGTVARAFWWGFHIEISHEDLHNFLAAADPINALIGGIGGGIPSPAAPFIAMAAAFVAGALGLLRDLDRGRGVYVSMSWFAPGIFVPTTVV